MPVSGAQANGPGPIVPLTTLRKIASVPAPPPTTFIGREAETKAVLETLRHPDVRVVTLTGPGGIGKTRLTLEMASEFDADFADGVAWVPLAVLRDSSLIAQAIASALDVRAPASGMLLDHLISALGRQRVLLVLDNFEHVVDAAPLVADIVRACPAVKALVTSRSPLRISGERVLPLSPLAVPNAEDRASAGRMTGAEAVQLFVDRANSVSPGFELNPETLPHVLHICRRLDGLPLAIELAGARVSHLSVQTLYERLTNRLPLLTGGPRDLPSRQQTLRNTIAWSFELLSPTEQRMFQQLAVFAGGFTLEAAESISDDADATLDLIAALVDKSLIHVQPRSPGSSRYAMLETILEFAAECLADSGEKPALRDRHAAFFLRMARQAEPELTSSQMRPWAERLEADHENVRRALSWLAETQQWPKLLQLAAALGGFWDVRGHLSEGRWWLERALAETAGTDVPAAHRALAGTWLGLMLVRQDALDDAETHLNAALRVWEAEQNLARIALTYCVLGGVAEYREDDVEAQRLYRRGLELYRDVSDPAGLATVLNNLADTAYRLGELDRASILAEEAVVVAREAGLDIVLASALFTIAEVAFAQGSWQDALDALWNGMETSRAAGYQLGLSDALSGIAAVAATSGDGERAARLLGAVESIANELEVRRIPHQTFHHRAIAAARADMDESAFAAAWNAGRGISLAEAVVEARSVRANPSTGLPDHFTPRERDVLRLLVAGKTDRAIGDELFIGTRTVESHVARIFAKLGVRSRAAAAATAVATGLVDPPVPPSETPLDR